MILTKHMHLLFLIGLLAMPASKLRADLLAHWTLDNDTSGLMNLGTIGSASDLSAAAPLGAITGGPTFTLSGGAAGGYASFDGTQALIGDLVGNAAEVIDGYPFTLSAWIRASATQVDRGAVVGLINRDANDQYISMGTETTAEGIDFQGVRRNGGFVGTEAPGTNATITDGNWHHIAAVFNATSSLRLYLDGELAGQASTSAVFAPGINTIGIGAQRRAAGFIDRFTGDVDDVQFYNEGLIATQIEWLFDNPGMGPPPPVLSCDVDLANGCTLDDLQIIADNFYTNVLTREEGDLNQDGIVDFADFRLWKNGPLSGEAARLYGVPEPATLPLLLLAIPALLLLRSRKRSD